MMRKPLIAAVLCALFAASLFAQTPPVPLGPSGSGSGSSSGSGTVTSVGETFTGGLIGVAGSPITTIGTLALTVAGTSGGIPFFDTSASWASSGVLAANSLMIGGGAGVAPSTVTTNATVLTALGSAPQGSGGIVLATSPTLTTPVLGSATGTSVTVTDLLAGTAFRATGTKPTSAFAGGTCAGGTLVGGGTAGTATLTGACAATNTWTLSGMRVQSTGYTCEANDRTTPAAILQETSTSTTSAVFTFSGTTGASDVIQYLCIGY
jgi:hypothetical protein